MALIFFGPRKLPQLSRSLGKSMAEFRRASEDFKRTWDREVNEEVKAMVTMNQPADGLPENSILAPASTNQVLQAPMIEAVSPDRVIARQPAQNIDPNSSAVDYAEPNSNQPEPSRKRDWI
ncbi:MAG: twin-arginine translocase TatA/TatE family subunit [Blastocatellia bacterium]|nr:twin-arginine translocase TatA/TatE family subunit [Blastocatellia bacterium]